MIEDKNNTFNDLINIIFINQQIIVLLINLNFIQIYIYIVEVLILFNYLFL